MKKVTLWILTALVVAVCVQPVFAGYVGKYFEIERKNGHKAAEAYQKRADTLNKKMDILISDVQKLADKIAAFNKPAFEAQLTKKEREYWDMGFDEDEVLISPVLWSRVWVKDKTLVFGMAKKDKKFRATYFATTDPEFVFLGGIRVGASIKTLEKFFGVSVDVLKDEGIKGDLIIGPQFDGTDGKWATIFIVYNKGLITEITADFTNDESSSVYSKKAGNFAKDKMNFPKKPYFAY